MASPTRKIADLDNQFDDDRVLRRYLERVLPESVRSAVTPDLRALGDLAGNELYDLQLQDRENQPSLTRFGPQGERIDHVELTDLWERGLSEAASHGVIGAAYERKHGRYSRIDQFARAYLLTPGTDMLGFLLATTDGAARVLLDHGPGDLADEVLPHLLSRDPDTFWTSGQWRTEKEGGSDLSQIETTARRDADGTCASTATSGSPARRPPTWPSCSRKRKTRTRTSPCSISPSATRPTSRRARASASTA
jgi:hypothetical protein